MSLIPWKATFEGSFTNGSLGEIPMVHWEIECSDMYMEQTVSIKSFCFSVAG